MKKLKNLKKILLMLGVIALICSISTVNKADVDQLIKDELQNRPYINPDDANGNNQTPSTQTPSTEKPSTTTPDNTTLPKTGVNDTAMWIISGVCVLGAIYAYKKVKDYTI